MNFKRSPYTIQNKVQRDFELENDIPTLADLMKEQNVSGNESNSVHHRRDLDSLG